MEQGPQGDGAQAGSPAPQLAGAGAGPAPGTPARPPPGGRGLLVFLSEHCPPSRLALRRVGPRGRAWAGAGLTAIAIFEDPLDLAIRTARRLGWTGQVAAQEPPYPASRDYGLAAVPTAVMAGRDGVIAGTVNGWDRP